MFGITEIRVTNYRSIAQATFPLSDFTALVGYNNAGKSNLLSAIRWFLRPSPLGEADFQDPSNPVEIGASLGHFDHDVIAMLPEAQQNDFKTLLSGGVLHLKRVQESPGGTARQIAAYVSKDVNAADWDKCPKSVDSGVKALFPEPIEISAMDDAGEDVGRPKAGTTITKLIGELVGRMEATVGSDISELLATLRDRFDAEGSDRPNELVELDAGCNKKLEALFPGISVQIHVPAPSFKDLFKSGTIRVVESDSDVGRDVSSLGHGAQRAIQMALVRHLAELQAPSEDSPSRTTLLIDEPELYLHPQAVEYVRVALTALSSGQYQVIFSTHSPRLISPAEIPDALIIRKVRNTGTHSLATLADAVKKTIDDQPSQARILFDLSNSSEFLFSDIVLLGEGPTERELIPDLFQSYTGTTLGVCRIGLVTVEGSGNLAKCREILRLMGLKILAVVDLDFAFKIASTAKLIEQDDPDLDACRRVLQRLSDEGDVELSNDGHPTDSQSLNAEQAFAQLASDDEAKPHIESLHTKMKEHGLWLWTGGSIEHHIGLPNKKERTRRDFAKRLRDTAFEDLVEDPSVPAFFDWLREAAT